MSADTAPAAMPGEEIAQTALLILQVLEAARERIHPDEESIPRLEPHVERIKARYGEIRGRSFSEAYQVSRVEFIRDTIAALFAPILAEKEREISTFDQREVEWNEAMAGSLQNEEDAHRKLEAAEAALAAADDALAPFAAMAEAYDGFLDDEDAPALAQQGRHIMLSDLRRARTAAAAIRAQGE